jgi:hypothetical protein
MRTVIGVGLQEDLFDRSSWKFDLSSSLLKMTRAVSQKIRSRDEPAGQTTAGPDGFCPHEGPHRRACC